MANEAMAPPQPVWPVDGTRIRSPRSANCYQLGSLIGEGNFSYVYACEDSWRNRLVAKVLKPRNLPFELVQQSAIRESGALEHLRHPNIVYVHDAFEFQNLFYIVMDRCDHDLDDLIKLPNFSGIYWFEAVARCLLQAIDFIHSRELVHCDIHLGNVMYKFHRNEMSMQSSSSITFLLGDMGLARPSNAISDVGTFLNSIRPPECLANSEFGPIDHRVDIYQAGLVLLQLYLGRSITFSEDQRLEGAPREMAVELPAPYCNFLEPMLRRHSIHRSSNAMEAWANLPDQ